MHDTCIKINLNRTFSKFYNSSENLAIEEVIVLCKGRVIFRQYMPKKRKCFGIKIYKLYEPTGHMYDMSLLGEGETMHGTVLESNSSQVTKLKRKTEGHGHKLYMDNFFSSKKFQ